MISLLDNDIQKKLQKMNEKFQQEDDGETVIDES